MKESEIIQNNKLIAEFMGDKFYKSSNVIENLKGLKLKYPDKWQEYLHFDTSWNWLMPIIEKIESLGKDTLISNFQIQISYNNKDNYQQNIVNLFVGNSSNSYKFKIEAVYQAVIEFIKWYNT